MKKILITFFLVFVTTFIFAISSNAAYCPDNEFVPDVNVYINSSSTEFCVYEYTYADLRDVILIETNGPYYYVNPKMFKAMVNRSLNVIGGATYAAWRAFLTSDTVGAGTNYKDYWLNHLNEELFNYWYNYDNQYSLYSMYIDSFLTASPSSVTNVSVPMKHDNFHVLHFTGSEDYLVNPLSFRLYVDTVINKRDSVTYAEFKEYIKDYSGSVQFLVRWNNGTYTEDDFNFLYNGINDSVYNQGATDTLVEINEVMKNSLEEFMASNPEDFSIDNFEFYLESINPDFLLKYNDYTFDGFVYDIYSFGELEGIEEGHYDINYGLFSAYSAYLENCNINGVNFTYDGFREFIGEDFIFTEDFFYVLKGIYDAGKNIAIVDGKYSSEDLNAAKKEGITEAHNHLSSWLEENCILSEPIVNNYGELDNFDVLIKDNIPSALNEYEQKGYVRGLNEGKNIGKTNGVNASIVQLRNWLKNNNHLWVEESFYTPNGDITLIDRMLNQNIPESLSNWRDSGYTAGYNQGLKSGNEEIFNRGYDDGYAAGLVATDGEAFNMGYNQGKNEGIAIGESTADVFKKGIFAIFSAPVDMIARVLNFELFGINLFYLISGLITLSLAFFVIKKIRG